jgi:hypothetical protein
MSSIFYDQFVNWPGAEERLRMLTQDVEEHRSLAELLDKTTHHEVFAYIFTVLPLHTHEIFIQRVKDEPHAEHHLHFIRTYDPNIDTNLRQVAETAHQKFFDAIHKRVLE